MSLDDIQSVGFTGLGAMGMWMAVHLVEKLPSTTRIYVFDVVTSLMNELFAKYPERVVRCINPRDVAEQSVSW